MVAAVRTGDAAVPALRLPGKRILNGVSGALLGLPMKDVNCGLRAFRRSVLLRYLHLMPNGFSFSTTSTFALHKAGRPVAYLPVRGITRKGGKSSASQWRDGSRALLLLLRLVVLFEPLRVFLAASAAIFGIGLVSLALDIARGDQGVADTTVLLFLTAVIIFFFGLLGDQVAAIRREKHE